MEKRIELEKRGRSSEEIRDLNLDNCRATQIEGLTEDLVNLEVLSLINVGLTSLKGFPKLPNLRKLELSDNRISGGLSLLNGCQKLNSLNLSGNKIKDLDTLKPLADLKELKNLDLFNCEVTGADNYRDETFNLLPDLTYLDGFDREDEEAEEGDDDEDDDDIDGEDGEDDDDEDEDGEDGVLVDGDEDVDDDDDDDDDGDDDDEDDDDEDEVGLSYLQKDGLEEESDGEEFEPGAEENADDDLEIEDGETESRGQKRKHDDEEDAS